MSSRQKNLVYALWQEVPKLVYAFWTCNPVCRGAVKQMRCAPPIDLGYTQVLGGLKYSLFAFLKTMASEWQINNQLLVLGTLGNSLITW